ncbi:DUF4241 domain-containing protein [Actinoallomurus sp. NPDC050550]|uniref:DUF4241 domain-containing protein n=1 Tax=Actinoallomurus sp. NPDC050550 TaxID=3154937 RepID=UPI0033DD666E
MTAFENQPDFALLLTDGAQQTTDSTRVTITREDGPGLTLPTGRLAVSGFGSGEPFIETVPPGTYATAVFTENIAQLEDDGVTEMFDFDEFGALQVTIADAPVESWEPAMVDYADRAGSETNAFFVDGGIGIACDAALAEMFLEMRDVMAPFEKTECSMLLAGVVDVESGANALCMMYGGDGVHESWIGRAADGSVACFVVV